MCSRLESSGYYNHWQAQEYVEQTVELFHSQIKACNELFTTLLMINNIF